MRRGNFFRVGLVALVFFALTLAVSTCGGRRQLSAGSVQPLSRNKVVRPAKYQPVEASLDDALAELEELACPEGVDAALWEDLKDALAAGLVTTNQQPTTRLVSSPPRGAANRVDDLEIGELQEGTYTLTWHYRNLGDYNQDGSVNVTDITPLAIHFGETANEANEWIDGNEDGVINIMDVTPVAVNFLAEVTGYSVQAADAPDGTFNEVAFESLNDASGEGKLTLSFDLPPGAPRWVRVVPVDGENTEGIASEPLHVLDPPPPNAIWMVPNRTTVEEGDILTVTVYANELANPLRLLDTAEISIGSDILSYVEDSWNAGACGGEESEKDGIWSLFTSQRLLGCGTVGGGVWPASPSNEVPPGTSGALYNFRLQASATGTATLHFAHTYGRYDYTFYTDIAGNKYYYEDSQELVIRVLSGHAGAFLDSESITSGAQETRNASDSKQASHPPTGPENAVYDLEITDNGDGTYTLSWSYTNVGDYNQDGIADSADGARIALHWEETADETNEWLDGNGDGAVNGMDITIIALNLWTECAGYSVQFGNSLDGLFAEVMAVPLDLTWEVNVRKRFKVLLSAPASGFYRVVPYDYSGNPGESSSVVELAAP